MFSAGNISEQHCICQVAIRFLVKNTRTSITRRQEVLRHNSQGASIKATCAGCCHVKHVRKHAHFLSGVPQRMNPGNTQTFHVPPAWGSHSDTVRHEKEKNDSVEIETFFWTQCRMFGPRRAQRSSSDTEVGFSRQVRNYFHKDLHHIVVAPTDGKLKTQSVNAIFSPSTSQTQIQQRQK